MQKESPVTSKSEERIVVIGSGLMGRGIGQAFATAEHNVTLVDLDSAILKDAKVQIGKSLASLSKNGLIDEPIDSILSRISLETELGRAASNASFALEAVFENLEAKLDTFKALDEAAPRDCVLASNTSSLPISKIASATTRPESVVGAHFWNPPQLMAAVEVVRGEKTSDETIRRTLEILKNAGKRPAVVQKDVRGQIGIRILYAMIREATWLVENQVASPEDIDSVVREALGTRLEVVGPLELSDLSGVDLVNNVAKGGLYASLDSSSYPQKIIQEMVARGDVGIKSGRGFYNWKDGSKDVNSIIKLRDDHLIKILRERRQSK
ncbi:MAG TPA: 3-hydroxyacyl-CoA dehydrogenase family protein [Nitrososphaerales archaeon]|nr:3-hydroxyacyl-CoA dehydrogenase family protein [Nitrososphaerales archaeon]